MIEMLRDRAYGEIFLVIEVVPLMGILGLRHFLSFLVLPQQGG
jgi:hypothetical protein